LRWLFKWDIVLDSLLHTETNLNEAAAASGLPGVQIFKNQQPISVGVLVRESAECLTELIQPSGYIMNVRRSGRNAHTENQVKLIPFERVCFTTDPKN
jgi:hypothetical protein